VKILVIAPHADDEINCAGLLSKHRHTETIVVAFSSCGVSALPLEFERSCDVLKASTFLLDYPVRSFDKHRQSILEDLVRLREDINPTWVICPSSTDLHQDHQVIYAEVMRAFRNSALVLGWESPNNQRLARVNSFVKLDASDLARKIAAFSCYESQRHRDYFDDDFISALAVVRGKQCRCASGFAEGYEVLSQCL